MCELAGPVVVTVRDIDAPGALAEVQARALLIWTRREQGFPAFTRQRWQTATLEARYATMSQAARELGFLPPA